MTKLLTFKDLKASKGWPHSRQHTARLVKAGAIPLPKKRPGGGAINLWDEDEWDRYTATFQSADPTPNSSL
jgi:hypothetical protein